MEEIHTHVRTDVFDYDIFEQLEEEEQEKALKWVAENMKPANTVNNSHSSYGLKHDLEHDTGIYMTNNQFKDMILTRTDIRVAVFKERNHRYYIQ